MHLPVMPEEALSLLNVRSDGTYMDATAGLGGHTRLIAQRLTTGIVIANDRDPESLEMARRNTAEWSDRIRFIHGPFDPVERMRWRRREFRSWMDSWPTSG